METSLKCCLLFPGFPCVPGAGVIFKGAFSAEKDIAHTAQDRKMTWATIQAARSCCVGNSFLYRCMMDHRLGMMGTSSTGRAQRGMSANMAIPYENEVDAKTNGAQGDELGHADGAEIAAVVGAEEFDHVAGKPRTGPGRCP